MTPVNEAKVIEEKLKELTRLVEEREQLQSRITKVEAAIRAFVELLEDNGEQMAYAARLEAATQPLGITGAVKRALLTSPKKLLGAIDIRDALVADEFPLSGYSNALAVIYTTLNRLCDQGFAEKEGNKFKLKAPSSDINEALRDAYREAQKALAATGKTKRK